MLFMQLIPIGIKQKFAGFEIQLQTAGFTIRLKQCESFQGSLSDVPNLLTAEPPNC